MSKSIILTVVYLGALSLTLSACGSRHSRVQGGNKPVMMTMFGKTDQQLNAIMQKAWGKEWNPKDAKSQQLASEISGIGIVTNSRTGDADNVTVTIVHADCKTEDVVMLHDIKAGGVQAYKVQIKCVSANQSCEDYTMLISKINAENQVAGSIAVYVRQNPNDFKKAGDEGAANEHSQVWWGKAKGEHLTGSKALAEKAKRCEPAKVEEKKTEEPPMYSEGE